MTDQEHADSRRASRRWPLGRILIVGTVLLLAFNSLLLYHSLSRLAEATVWLGRTAYARQLLGQVVADVMTAEAAQRSYLITGKSHDLLPYGRAVISARDAVAQLVEAVADDAAQARRLTEAREVIEARFTQLRDAVETRVEAKDANVAQLLAQSNQGGTGTAIRNVFRDVATSEDILLAERQALHRQSQVNAYISLVVFVLTTIALIIGAYVLMRRELHSRKQSEQRIKQYAETLDHNVDLLQAERNQIALVNEMSNFLQSCHSLEEVARLSKPFFLRLFPEHTGAFRVFAASRNQLKLVTGWCEGEILPYVLPDDCWALRRGQIHCYDASDGSPACEHCRDSHVDAPTTICVPLQAFGETLGLLSIECVASARDVESDATLRRLATMVGRQLGLTLATLKARETLNEQSIRDPLTNAFNRRYLDVLATKELAQAARYDRNLTIVMFDVDHFKKFNDVHGHRAGDAALVAIVSHIHRVIREGDWLFRYGGEEFLLMMADTDADDAFQKADELRRGIADLTITLDDEILPRVTVSMGIASFPSDAQDFDAMVEAADEALYRAKSAGRNRAYLASVPDRPQALSA